MIDTDGNTYSIQQHIYDCEEADAWAEMEELLEAYKEDAEAAEKYVAELEAHTNEMMFRIVCLEAEIAILRNKGDQP